VKSRGTTASTFPIGSITCSGGDEKNPLNDVLLYLGDERMKKDLSKTSMFIILIASALMIVSIFLPWWHMDFYAPQYPEGLDIIVTPTEVKGDIETINNLNHYIGMGEFSTESFPELQYMIYIIIALAVIFAIAGLFRSKKLLYVAIGIYMIFGALGIWDMYRWLHAYGTDLDPRAPIDLEPFTPPIIGENTIANFVTFSKFSSGALILAIVFFLLIFPLWKDRKR